MLTLYSSLLGIASSYVGHSSPSLTKNSDLISIFERVGISIKCYVKRVNVSSFGVLWKVRIGMSLALVADVSGYGLSRLNISIRGLIPDDSPVMLACFSGDYVKVKQLLDDGPARPNDYTPGNQSLLSASALGYHKRRATCAKLRLGGYRIQLFLHYCTTTP